MPQNYIPVRAVHGENKPFNNCKQNPKRWCGHSNETSSTVLSHRTTCLESSSNFWVCGWNPMVLPFKSNLFSSTLTRCYIFSTYSCSSHFESVDDILRCDYSNETSCSRGTIPLVCSSSYDGNTINFRIVWSFVCGRNRVLAPLMKSPRYLAASTLDSVARNMFGIFEKLSPWSKPKRLIFKF